MRQESSHDDFDDDPGHTRLYTLLRLRPTCSAEDVQRSFRLLSRVFHPDKASLSSTSSSSAVRESFIADRNNSDDRNLGTDEDTFVELQMCVEVLADPVLRRGYDVGGVQVVRLLQRSQRHHHPSRAEEAAPLYEAVERASSDDEAEFLLRRALEEFQRQEEHRRGKSTGGGGGAAGPGATQIDSSLMCPMIDFEQESSAVSVSLKRPITPQKTIMSSISHSLQPSGVGQMSVGVGYEFSTGTQSKLHPSGSSTYAADARFSNRKRKDKPGQRLLGSADLALRTTRQLASGSVIAVDLFGNLLKKMSWTYSISSFRNLKWVGSGSSDHPYNDADESPPSVQLQALWRCRIQAATGRVASLVAQLRTTEREEAQYRVRLSLINPNSIKFAYRSSSYSGPEGGLAVSWSAGFWDVWNKVKVTWCQRIGGGRITCRYGIKYDGRASLLLHAVESVRFDSVSPWTLVAYIYSNETCIRLPISLSSGSSALPACVAGMVSLLLAQWIEPILDDMQGHEERDERDAPTDTMSLQTNNDRPAISEALVKEMPAGFREVAKRKRDAEAKVDGLVVLFVSLDGERDSVLKDTFQFWVVSSSLRLPKAEVWNLIRKRSPSQESSTTSWKDWLGLSAAEGRGPSNAHTTSDGTTVTLTVRYSYHGWVYESTFSNKDDWIVIPNVGTCGTTQIGRRSQVY